MYHRTRFERRTWPIKLVILLIGLLIGFGLGNLRTTPARQARALEGASEIKRMMSANTKALLSRIGELQNLVEKPALLAPDSNGHRVSAVSPDPSTERVELPCHPNFSMEQVSELEHQIKFLGEMIIELIAAYDLQNEIVIDGSIAVLYPNFELLSRASAEPNWAELRQIVHEDCAGGSSMEYMLDRLQWKTQEEILDIFGRPTIIDDNGDWEYKPVVITGEFHSCVKFSFIRNYVMDVTSYMIKAPSK